MDGVTLPTIEVPPSRYPFLNRKATGTINYLHWMTYWARVCSHSTWLVTHNIICARPTAFFCPQQTAKTF